MRNEVYLEFILNNIFIGMMITNNYNYYYLIL